MQKLGNVSFILALVAKYKIAIAGDSSYIKASILWNEVSGLKPNTVIINKLYLPFIGRVYWSQLVKLFQKEDVTWPDHKGCFTVSEELL